MNSEKLIKSIEILVKEACKKDTNLFGYRIWSHHIIYVVKYAKLLVTRLGADCEIVEIAALLHDYAGIINQEFQPEHHIYGAQEAEIILCNYDYPICKIEKVKNCILNHRSSILTLRVSAEENCVASADAMAHIDQVASLLYLAYKIKGLDIEEGKAWVRSKLERDWIKLCPEAKEIIGDTYKKVLSLLKE